MRHKYGATRTELYGESFPSRLEASVFQQLMLRAKMGELENIQRQACVRLMSKCKECGSGPVDWKVDFSAVVIATGETIYIEAKGVETSDYKKRKRLWKTRGPGVLQIYKGSWRNPRIVEEIYPEGGK